MFATTSAREKAPSRDVTKASSRHSLITRATTAKEEHDKRYFLGAYGTFDMDTVHARLFELQVYIDMMKNHTFVYFAFTLIALLIWPIAAILAIPLTFIAGNDRDLQIFKVILVSATAIGLLLWTIPFLIVMLGGGVDHFHHLIKTRQLNWLDFVDFILSELMILLTVLFAWVFHEITINTAKYKESAMISWKGKRENGDYGMDIRFQKAQYNRLLKVLEDSEGGVQTGDHKEIDENVGSLPLEDVVSILEELPGWNGPVCECRDHFFEKTQIRTGLFEALQNLTEEATEKNLWPIDLWMVRDQFYPEHTIDLDTGLYVFYKNTVDLLKVEFDFLLSSKVSMILVCLLAIIRAFLPRIWLKLVLGGVFWPEDGFGPAGMLVLYSTVVTFVVSVVWIGLFWYVLMEYKRNLVQCMIVSSLIDAKSRVTFSQNYLMSMMWFKMDSPDAEDVLRKLPLIDLRVSSNVACFWRIRDYCTLDRSNERMSISVLLEIVIIWLLLKFIATFAIMYIHGGLPAVLAVTLFDICLFGTLIISSLNSALAMNNIMDGHKQVFVDAKYEVTMARGMQQQDAGPKDNEPKKDLELCRRLLTEYLDLCKESDARDKILFGMAVTPGKIVSSAGTFAAMVYALVMKSVKNGDVAGSGSMEEKEGNVQAAQLSLMAMQTTVTTVKFLAQNARPLMRWGA